MAFVGLAFGTIFGFATAALAYTLVGMPLLVCFFIYAFSGAAFALLTVLGLSARCSDWHSSTGIDADFDRAASRDGRKSGNKFQVDIA